MSKSIKSLRRAHRNTLASAAALALAAAAPAMAETMDNGYYRFGQYDGSADQTLALNNYVLSITTPQLNTGYLTGVVSGVTYQALLSGPAGMGTPVVQTGNSIAALATANQAASSIALGLLAQGAEGSDGAAIMTGQLRRDGASQAVVANSGVSIRLDGMPVADQVISANTLSAATTLNQSASSIEGVLPAGYASVRPGRASTSIGMAGNEGIGSGVTLDSSTTASVGITTAQISTNAGLRAGSNASLFGSGVSLAATSQGSSEGPNQVAAQLSVTGNDLSAQYTGNRASSRFNAQAGSAPFEGSVAVTNLQSNVEDAGLMNFSESGPQANARVSGTAIRADLRGGEGARSELTGALAVTGNSVLAASTGNTTTARDGAGTSIVVDGGAELRGAQSSRMNMAGTFGGTAGSGVLADLALASVQGNRDTGFVSEVLGTGVSATLDQVAAGASVSLNGNSIDASATGNAAGNRIQADATRLSASAAAGNVQSNSWTDVNAANLGSRIDSNIGTIGRDASGSVSLSANRLGALVTGNLADTQLALSATNLATGGMPASALASAWEGGFGGAGADVSAVNVQSNLSGTIAAQLTGGGIAANFADQSSEQGTAVGLQGASLALKDNLLRSQAIGNDAATGVSLAATTASTSAALAGMQTNSAWVSSNMSGMGVTASAGNVRASNVALDGNSLLSAAVANRADNQLQARLGSLQSGATGVGGIGFIGMVGEGGGTNTANGDMGTAVAAFTLVNAQSNDGAVNSRNVSEGAMVQASVGSNAYNEGSNWPGVIASNVSVKGNLVAAASTGNQAANTLSLQVDAMAGAGSNGPVAAVNSVQSGWSEGRSDATAGGSGAQLVGVRYKGELDSSTIAVTGNAVSASNLGNTATNQLQASGTSFAAANGSPLLRDLRGDVYTASVSNDFSLVNQQYDGGAGRSASTTNVNIGIDSVGFMGWGGAADSTLTLSGNRNLAEARNNNAVNGISLGGYSVLGAGAGLLNGQDSGSQVSASASGEVRAGGTGFYGSTVALTDNVTRALAVANSADNSIVAQATTLQGSVVAPVVVVPFASEGGSGVASSAGFALGSIQSHSGVVDALASGSARIETSWDGMYGSNASVTGNLVMGIAQANSATNTLALGATTVNGVTGAVTSMQTATGSVSARAQASIEGGAFVVDTPWLYGTQATVSNNTMRASAGQNEAFNQQTVTAASITAGNNASAFTIGPINASSGASNFTVSSEQSGTGNVDATALPGSIGVVAFGAYGGGFTVKGNQVAARANVNTASNGLTLDATAGLGAGGSVSNLQTTGNGSVTAMVGSYESPMLVGVSASALNGTAVAVTGNSLAAQAGGNNGANVLNASGSTTAVQGSAAPSFAVLNSQTNAASMNAAVRNATIGVAMNSYEGGMGMNSASATVQANSVAASGYGNTASNAIALGMPQAANGSATSLASRQANTAPISAMVANVTIGLVGANANGSSGVISGNSVSAQAIGNAVVNTISVK